MKTKEQIIDQIKEVHGDLYDLSRVDYKGMKKPIVIGCVKHGWKEMTPSNIIYNKSGCSDCGRERSEAAKYRSFEDVLKQVTTIHNDKYSYSKIKNYTGIDVTYIIGCPIHGDFEQVFSNHIVGKGCDKCGRISTSTKRRLTQEEVVEKCIKSHGDTYDLSRIEYTTDREPIEIVCKKHGSFPALPINFMRGHGCSKCGDERVAKHFRENPIGWGLRAWKESASKSKNFDSFKVYKVRCWNDEEEFYKIGRTFLTVRERLKGNMNGYDFETIEVIEGTAEEIYELETQLKRKHKEYKYIPKINFGGRYECFSKIICTT